MKQRVLLCALAAVALAIAFVVWPSKGYNPADDAELQEVIASSARGAELEALVENTPMEQQREMAFLLKNMN